MEARPEGPAGRGARAPAPPASLRVLGLAGIVSGLFLLAACVVFIPPDVNLVRILSFLVGSMAVATGLLLRAVPQPSRGIVPA